MNKKGFFTMHAGIFFLIGLVIGFILAVLIAKGTIPIGISLC